MNLISRQRRFEELCERISAALSEGGVTPETLIATLPEARERVYERRYGVGRAEIGTPQVEARGAEG